VESDPLSATKPIFWRGIHPLSKLVIIGLPLLTAAVLVLRNLDEAYLRRLARLLDARPIILWLANGANAWLLAIGLLLLATVYLLWIRYRVVNDKRLWSSSGCPYCMERELVRVKRHASDRRYRFVGIPAYRYACRNCSWRGLRIGRREVFPEWEKELEEAVISLQPDGLPAARPGGNGVDEDLMVSAQEVPLHSDFPNGSDVEWLQDFTSETYPDVDRIMTDQPGHQDDSERFDEMDWLWRRPSEN
jgi:hypothetical protein